MMKKKFIYSLPVLVALAFNGCGSSSTTEIIEDTVTESQKLISSGYSVVVERGAVLDANVTDANGSVAVQVSDTNNTYIFENEPVYPITAEGGWIDVDGDGNLTEEDVALDINLTSYSDVITPTTTYCSDENETIREERLQELAAETNCTKEELLTVPSEATKNSIMVLNAVYEKLIEKGNTHSNAPIAISAILERYTEIDNNANLDENATSLEMALALEEQTMFNLNAKGLIKKLDNDDIEDFKAKKPKKLKDEGSIEEDDDSSEEDKESTETDDDSTSDNSNGNKPDKDEDKESTESDDKVTGSDNSNGNKPDKDEDKESTESEDKVTGSDNSNGNKPDKDEDKESTESDDKVTGSDNSNGNKPDKSDNPNKK